MIEQDETEQNWDKIQREIQRVAALFRGGGYQFEAEVVQVIKPLLRPIINAVRTPSLTISNT